MRDSEEAKEFGLPGGFVSRRWKLPILRPSQPRVSA